MRRAPFQQDPAGGPAELPRGLDAMSVGQSIFSHPNLPETPVVEGYSQLSFIAHGGFGHVWRARRDSDGAPVALKIPHQTDPETAERLDAEAEALKALDHPHIVRLLQLTESANGAPVLVMELIDGPSLTARLPDGGFDFDHALQLFLPVLDAVAHAHSRGIVHRDLKPSNVLLTADGTPKVSDFGLAQSVKDRRVAFSLTRSGLVAGTVEYLAPECYEPGSIASAASDIYALGIILYELLTGHPPRGAWQPVSQIKHLDVRLDELIGEATCPDPARRMSSAPAFRQRLEEIRDSRPRYAGTPLVTRPVRFADFFWTIAGLYFLAAGFCSLLGMNNTRVPAIFDLTFYHRKLLGGYWALFVLTLGMSLVWTWQAIRLWRFRRIPLREALPAPFGLRIGTSAGSAFVVALTQLVCAWAPLVYMGWIYSQIWFWAGPETVPWEAVLAVTRNDSNVPVSPWTWDPAGMVIADEFWIREVHLGSTPETWTQFERQSFFVFTQPLLMTICAVAIGFGVLMTIASAVKEWIRRRWKLLTVSMVSVWALAFSMHATVKDEQTSRGLIRKANAWGLEQRMGQEISPNVRELITHWEHARSPASDNELQRTVTKAFAPVVEFGTGNMLPRDVFLTRLLEALPPEGSEMVSATVGTLFYPGFRPAPDKTPGFRHQAEHYTVLPNHSATGTFVTVFLEGRLSDAVPNSFPVPESLTAWIQQDTPLYRTVIRPLPTEDAIGWLESWLRCLSIAGCPNLESYFLPVILDLVLDNTDVTSWFPTSCGAMIAVFRKNAANGGYFNLAPGSIPSLRTLPGGRWEITCNILPSAMDGRKRGVDQSLTWRIEIVFVDDRWQILRLRM